MGQVPCQLLRNVFSAGGGSSFGAGAWASVTCGLPYRDEVECGTRARLRAPPELVELTHTWVPRLKEQHDCQHVGRNGVLEL